jgi:hypothetical protein
VRFDPKNTEALQMIREPQNSTDLVQNVAAVKWMHCAIPNNSKHVVPIQTVLAKDFEGKSRRTKQDATAVSLPHLWGLEEQDSLKKLQAAIMEAMTLAFPDQSMGICVLTDASDLFYADSVTQIHK